MSIEWNPFQESSSGDVVHQFTVQRGMAVAIVISTFGCNNGLIRSKK